MELLSADISALLADFDRRREELGLSYQAIADACGVSQSTVIRIFRGQVDPSVHMVQQLATAVKYAPEAAPLVPDGYTQEGYVQFLRDAIACEQSSHEMRLRQQEAHYNQLLQHERRVVRVLSIILMLMVAAFIIWLMVDVTRLDIGWVRSAG